MKKSNKKTYRRKTCSTTASVRLQTARGRSDASQSLRVGKPVGVPSLRTTQIIGIGVVQRRVQTLKTSGVVASHGVFVEVDGHGTVGIELTRGLTVQGLWVTLGAGRTGRRIVVIHILRLLITHGGLKYSDSSHTIHVARGVISISREVVRLSRREKWRGVKIRSQ